MITILAIAIGAMLVALIAVTLFAWALVSIATFERDPDWQEYEGTRPSDQSWRR